jgi:hypothetical protein
VNIPEEIFSLPLKHSELKTLVAIYRTCVGGVSDISTEELKSQTGYSTETLRRAFRALESLGVLVTERTKKSYSHVYSNRYSNNRYHVKLWSSVVGSSSDTGSSNYHTVGKTVVKEDTSYLLMPQAAESEVQKMTRWKNEDDDEVGGFGLFEEEVQEKVASKVKPPSKRDPRTRGRRPVEDWTVYDVASEFSYRLGRKFPYSPGLVNVQAISGALRQWRNAHGITPTVEVEIMNAFFSDDRNYIGADKNPEQVHKWYLRMFKTQMADTLIDFGITADGDDDSTKSEEFVYASDGKRFDNSNFGRRERDRYEATLEG